MTKFLNGPAQGQVLMLKNARKFLRAVCAGSVWDALDKDDDSPAVNETIYAYQLVGKLLDVPVAHINMGRKGSGWYAMAEYTLVDPQPAYIQMRDSDLWRKWCEDREQA